jgi:hypothetical protein
MRIPVPRARALALLLIGTIMTVCAAADVARSKADADAMLRKIAIIATHGLADRPAARQTAVTEREVNSFLAFHARSEIPPGVMDPAVSIDDAGRLTGRAIVDLDEVRKARQGDAFGVLSLVSGRVPVEATGVLRTAGGSGQFTLETASVSGVPVPKALLQEVVSYYSRSAENPAGIDIEAPFELPVNIREIQTRKGEAIVVQ